MTTDAAAKVQSVTADGLGPLPEPAAWSMKKGGEPYRLMYERDDRGGSYEWEPLYDQVALDAAVAAERERCCRVVVAQRDERLWEVARRTILAIRAGDDYHDLDDERLLRE